MNNKKIKKLLNEKGFDYETMDIDNELLNQNIKDWYIEKYPNDELGELLNADVTFNTLLECLIAENSIYKLLETSDIEMRENIFKELSALINCDYDDICTTIKLTQQK